MAQPPPVIRKTKKSSYKPLSKLNEDNLTELKRVEKPEYTNRVFFHNTSIRARLVNDVNVWFRHHSHTMTALNKQQRAIMKLMVRMQKDRHRARQTEYKRKQQEIRDNMKRLQTELLQRRVVQKFRRNAANKMAARGEVSIAAMRLEAQRRLGGIDGYESPGAPPEEGTGRSAALLESSVDHAAVVNSYECQGSGDDVLENNHVDKLPPLRNSLDSSMNSSKNSMDGSSTDSDGSDKKIEAKKRGNSNKGKCPRSLATHVQSKTAPTVADPTVLKLSAGPLELIDTSVKSDKFSTRLTSTERTLDLIKEASSPQLRCTMSRTPPWEDSEGEADQDVLYDLRPPVADSFLSVNSRVVEVRRHRPNSPSIVTRVGRRATSKSLPAELGEPTMEHDYIITEDALTFPHAKPKPNQDPMLTSRNSAADSVITDLDRTPGTTSESSEVIGSRTKSDPPFYTVPSRQKVEEDAMTFRLLNEEEAPNDDSTGRKGEGRTLAARVKRQRKQEATRRAKLLDSEPLVQYYRSVRGTLQPLQTEPCRRSFPLPSGRPRYEQTKLLREEREKDVARKHSIDKFFTDLFSRRYGDPQLSTETDDSDDTVTQPTSNHLELLLRKMRQSSTKDLPTIKSPSDRNSVEQLAKCQYLRLYDRDPKLDPQKLQDGEGGKLTSWATAESELKSGFLALNFRGHV